MSDPTGSELSLILGELKTLLDRNNMDEGWADWLTERSISANQDSDHSQWTHFLLHLQAGEATLYQLRTYLPERAADGTFPRQEFDHLLFALEDTLCRTLGRSKGHPLFKVKSC